MSYFLVIYLVKGAKVKFTGYIIIILSAICLCGCGAESKMTVQQRAAAPNTSTEQRSDSDTVSNELPLIAAPWFDGEMMRMKTTSLQGDEIGTMIYSAESVTKDSDPNKRGWRIISHNYTSSSDLRQYAVVDTRLENFKPQFSRIINLLGDFRVEYGDKRIRLEITGAGGEIKRDVDVSDIVYDSEQLVHLVRRLPLVEDYKISFPVFAVMMGTVVDCNTAVIGKEQITTGAGTFDCYRVNLAIRSGENKTQEHLLWISADEHRYLVRYVLGKSMILELAEVAVADKDMPLIFEDGELGCAFAVPHNWRFYKHKVESGFFVELLSPELKAEATLCVLPAPKSIILPEIARQDIATFTKFFKDYAVSSDGVRIISLRQLTAVQYAADFFEDADASQAHRSSKKKTEYRTYIAASDKIYLFVFRTEKDEFDKLKGEFDAIMQSLELQK
jgi:hypothetical protein